MKQYTLNKAKNKLFIILTSLTVAFLFSISALCNQCAMPTKTTESQQQANLSGSGQNHNPVINSITISDNPVICNSTVEVWVDATDIDSDNLTYKWAISGGNATIDAIDSPHTTFKAPSSPTSVKIMVGVVDQRGGYAESAIDVAVVLQGQSQSSSSQDASGSQGSSGSQENISQNESEEESSQNSQSSGNQEESPQTSEGWEGGEHEPSPGKRRVIEVPLYINYNGRIYSGNILGGYGYCVDNSSLIIGDRYCALYGQPLDEYMYKSYLTFMVVDKIVEIDPNWIHEYKRIKVEHVNITIPVKEGWSAANFEKISDTITIKNYDFGDLDCRDFFDTSGTIICNITTPPSGFPGDINIVDGKLKEIIENQINNILSRSGPGTGYFRMKMGFSKSTNNNHSNDYIMFDIHRTKMTIEYIWYSN